MLKKLDLGFTLIELLVTITIIGTLAGIVAAVYPSIFAQGRDQQRIHDLAQLRTAIELYYQDVGDYPPAGTSYVAGWDGCVGQGATLGSYLVPKYIKQIPLDPLSLTNGGPQMFCYWYRKGTGQNQWTLYAHLERPLNGVSTCPASMLYTASISQFNYCITQQQ